MKILKYIHMPHSFAAKATAFSQLKVIRRRIATGAGSAATTTARIQVRRSRRLRRRRLQLTTGAILTTVPELAAMLLPLLRPRRTGGPPNAPKGEIANPRRERVSRRDAVYTS